MGIFGEKCVRCGRKRTRSEFEGLPTCKECELKVLADREHKRTCPVDGAQMEKRVVRNVVVDRCPSCHGAWLDGDEICLIKGVLGQISDDRFATGLLLGLIIGDD
jgi:hypothetical protein